DVPIGRAVGPVRAEDAGSDRILEVSAERRVLLRDPCDRIADATGHRLAGAIGHVARLAHPPAGAVGGRQLLGEELDLLVEAGGAARVSPPCRFVVLGLQVFETLAVLAPRLSIENFTRIAEPASDLDATLTPDGDPHVRSRGEIGGVKVPIRVTQEVRDVLQTLGVLQAHSFSLVSDRPEVAVT